MKNFRRKKKFLLKLITRNASDFKKSIKKYIIVYNVRFKQAISDKNIIKIIAMIFPILYIPYFIYYFFFFLLFRYFIKINFFSKLLNFFKSLLKKIFFIIIFIFYFNFTLNPLFINFLEIYKFIYKVDFNFDHFVTDISNDDKIGKVSDYYEIFNNIYNLSLIEKINFYCSYFNLGFNFSNIIDLIFCISSSIFFKVFILYCFLFFLYALFRFIYIYIIKKYYNI